MAAMKAIIDFVVYQTSDEHWLNVAPQVIGALNTRGDDQSLNAALERTYSLAPPGRLRQSVITMQIECLLRLGEVADAFKRAVNGLTEINHEDLSERLQKVEAVATVMDDWQKVCTELLASSALFEPPLRLMTHRMLLRWYRHFRLFGLSSHKSMAAGESLMD